MGSLIRSWNRTGSGPGLYGLVDQEDAGLIGRAAPPARFHPATRDRRPSRSTKLIRPMFDRSSALPVLHKRRRRSHLGVSRPPLPLNSGVSSPFTTAGFARMVERAGVEAKLGFPAHPHMLRHACGFALANKGHDTRALQAYLGHRNIQHTVRYTNLSPGRFKDFWR
jgi:integrase